MRLCVALIAAASLSACRVSDLLNTPVPLDVTAGGDLHTPAGAQALRLGAIAEYAEAVNVADFGQIRMSGTLADEFKNGVYGQPTNSVDARSINPQNSPFDKTYTLLQKSRGAAAAAVTALERYGGPGVEGDIGEMFALEGYAIVLLAEDVCAGVPLSSVDEIGNITYGQPLSGDALLVRATALFDSAVAHGGASDVAGPLARVGKGRALLDRGQFSAAAAAVAGVPATFTYGTQLADPLMDLYHAMASISDAVVTVSDREGTNGLAFVSAGDPRLPTTNLGATPNGLPLYYPLSFPLSATNNQVIWQATGIEARLIRAEALLPAHGGAGSAWVDTLNALRSTVSSLGPIADPAVSSAQVDTLFAERAFWMFGTGHRLGDMRRLIRQYGRDQSTVFPVGARSAGSDQSEPAYGTDVNFPIAIPEEGNPYFHGCLNRGA